MFGWERRAELFWEFIRIAESLRRARNNNILKKKKIYVNCTPPNPLKAKIHSTLKQKNLNYKMINYLSRQKYLQPIIIYIQGCGGIKGTETKKVISRMRGGEGRGGVKGQIVLSICPSRIVNLNPIFATSITNPRTSFRLRHYTPVQPLLCQLAFQKRCTKSKWDENCAKSSKVLSESEREEDLRLINQHKSPSLRQSK